MGRECVFGGVAVVRGHGDKSLCFMILRIFEGGNGKVNVGVWMVSVEVWISGRYGRRRTGRDEL